MVTVSADQKIRIRLKAYDHNLLDRSRLFWTTRQPPDGEKYHER